MVERMKKTFLKSLWDFIGIPFRFVLFDQKWLGPLGWTTLEEERIEKVLPHVRGRLLDIGAGPNTLVTRHGDGVGVDVHDWSGGVVVVKDSSKLPFEDASFDTITFVACLNHIPNRMETLKEARRLIRPGGSLIITMIGPLIGGIGHKIWWYSEDKRRGGMEVGELGGMTSEQIVRLCEDASFRLRLHKRFQFGLNNLYVFEPVAQSSQD